MLSTVEFTISLEGHFAKNHIVSAASRMDFTGVRGFVVHFLIIILIVLQSKKQMSQLVGTILSARYQANTL